MYLGTMSSVEKLCVCWVPNSQSPVCSLDQTVSCQGKWVKRAVVSHLLGLLPFFFSTARWILSLSFSLREKYTVTATMRGTQTSLYLHPLPICWQDVNTRVGRTAESFFFLLSWATFISSDLVKWIGYFYHIQQYNCLAFFSSPTTVNNN